MLEIKGYVETPSGLVDLMVTKLFKYESPSPHSKILVPGCGKGTFIEGIIRWCEKNSCQIPRIVGIELDTERALKALSKFIAYPSVSIENKDYLIADQTEESRKFDFIIGNPPYVPINNLSEEEKERYRKSFLTAQGRFDLYLLFFERSLQCLKYGGRLVFVTPEKFMYVQAAAQFRRLLSNKTIEEIQLLPEGAFADLVTYPAVTVIVNEFALTSSRIISASGELRNSIFCSDGSAWLPYDKSTIYDTGITLMDICERISCGVATGADSVFVKKNPELDSALKPFAYPTIAGRGLIVSNSNVTTEQSIITPYYPNGKLMDLCDLEALIAYLSETAIRKKLESRYCAAYKPWYAFHENPPLHTILRPKILCKDIAKQPYFWVDKGGTIVPRHSVYYIVPKDPAVLEEIADYLNSFEAKNWLENHCQHAANSFLRLQSHVLKKLPIPKKYIRNFGVTKQSDAISTPAWCSD